MNAPSIPNPRREELIADCRRQRGELMQLADEAVARSHARDILRALRFARRLFRVLSRV